MERYLSFAGSIIHIKGPTIFGSFYGNVIRGFSFIYQHMAAESNHSVAFILQ